MTDASNTERQAADPDSREDLSVSQLNDRIASVVQDTPALSGPHYIGEVTDLHQNSTALHFTLADGDAEVPCMVGAVQIQIKSETVCFLRGSCPKTHASAVVSTISDSDNEGSGSFISDGTFRETRRL